VVLNPSWDDLVPPTHFFSGLKPPSNLVTCFYWTWFGDSGFTLCICTVALLYPLCFTPSIPCLRYKTCKLWPACTKSYESLRMRLQFLGLWLEGWCYIICLCYILYKIYCNVILYNVFDMFDKLYTIHLRASIPSFFWGGPVMIPPKSPWQVVISQCISIRSNGMMDSFMVRYNHYSQSVIRSQQLGKEGGFVCDKNMGKTKIQWFVLCLVYHQIGINHLTLYTHIYIYIIIKTVFFLPLVVIMDSMFRQSQMSRS